MSECDIRREGCVTCGDEALPATVLALADDGWTAQAEVAGEALEIDISLLDGVRPGEVLLVHGGVALGRAEAL